LANAEHHTSENAGTALSIRRIIHTWWPLAASWLFMATEGPMMNAVVARMAEPEINLAAWGGVVFPIALIVEAPIIMLLSASTALSKDWDSYRKLRRFMIWMAGALTAIHALIAFTPLYYFVAVKLIGAPKEIIEPARLGMMIMTPWTASIAYRRFNQGVLIRFGHSRAVGIGTVIRLSTDALILTLGYLLGANRIETPLPPGAVSGIVVAGCAIASGVISEAIYAALRVRPVLRGQLRQAPPAERPLTLQTFLEFYTPLAMTALLEMLVRPIGSAALSRMPAAIDSLALWSVISSFLFLFRSLGFAYNEVVIALLDEPRAARNLQRFATWLTALATVVLLVIAATPLATAWFEHAAGLKPHLVALARRGLLIALPIPGLTVLRKWFEGSIVHSQHTRGVTEAVAIFLLVDSALLWAGVAWGQMLGLYVGLIAFAAGTLIQTVWLWRRSRPIIRRARAASGLYL